MMSPESCGETDVLPFVKFLKEINPEKTEAAETLRKAGCSPS